VFEIAVYTVMDGLISHWDRNDHFSRSPNFPFRDTTSSRLNTHSAQEPGGYSLGYDLIVSKNYRGISSRAFSWSRLLISDSSSLCRNKKESTHPGVTVAPKVSPQ
jgi:hypothetical protein